MKNGVYHYSMKMSAPIGFRYGRLELDILDGRVGGFLTMFSKRLPIAEGSCRGGTLRFSGKMQTLLYPLLYKAEGTVNEESVRVVFHTDKKGRFPAEGTAVAEDDKEKQTT
ncbi:MAG: hypothetical protein ACI4PC_09575 [Oscillospiraceae bacterium]